MALSTRQKVDHENRPREPLQLPQIIFPQKLFSAPDGSREGENFNLRHKSRDEILCEMIDEGIKSAREFTFS